MSTGKVLAIGIPAVLVAIVVIVASLIGASIRKLESYEMGIKYDTILRELNPQVFTEGVHFGPVGYRFIKYPSVYRTLEHDDLICLNKDGVKVMIDVSYQYIPKKSALKLITEQFKDSENYERVLHYTGQSAIQEVCANYKTEQFQTERKRIRIDIMNRIRERYVTMHASVTDLQTRDIRRPREYEDIIRKKEEARAKVGIVREERPRLITQAETKVQQALKQYNITVMKAQSDARIIIARAKLEADGISAVYKEQAGLLKEIRSTLGFTNDQLVNYMAIRTLAAASKPVFVSMKAPAKMP